MSEINKKTKIYDFIVGTVSFILLTSCQPSTPSVQTPTKIAPLQDGSVPQFRQAVVPDIVGDLIDQVEEEQIKPIEEVDLVASRPAVSLPVDDVRSRLAEEALNAALGLLKTNQPRDLSPAQSFSLPQKFVNKLRIGFLLPFSGNFENLGRDIAGGAEMACFRYRIPKLILFLIQKAAYKQNSLRVRLLPLTWILLLVLYSHQLSKKHARY